MDFHTGPNAPAYVPEEWTVPDPVAITLDSKSDALVVVDLQREYCHPKGRKYLQAARDILPNILTLLTKFRSQGATVLFTKVYFDPNDHRFSGLESRTYPRKGEWGFELVDELNLTGSDVVVEKNCYDPFLSSNMESAMR
ncbi:MAG: cysteine hydrolase, partial [Aigarchaeota archaeon]|nr:cysteine hydrolase [Aigarchaeota archaeon]